MTYVLISTTQPNDGSVEDAGMNPLELTEGQTPTAVFAGFATFVDEDTGETKAAWGLADPAQLLRQAQGILLSVSNLPANDAGVVYAKLEILVFGHPFHHPAHGYAPGATLWTSEGGADGVVSALALGTEPPSGEVTGASQLVGVVLDPDNIVWLNAAAAVDYGTA